MKALRLPSPFSFTSVSLVPDTACDTVLFLAPDKVSVFTLPDRTCSGMACPLLAILRAEELGSPVFPCNPLLSLPCSKTPTEPLQLAMIRWFGVVPGSPMPKTSVKNLSRLNSKALTVTVYASCLYLYRRRKTRFRRLAKPYRVDWLLPGC